MALTDIARQLKDTFEDFGGADLHEEVTRFKEIYGTRKVSVSAKWIISL